MSSLNHYPLLFIVCIATVPAAHAQPSISESITLKVEQFEEAGDRYISSYPKLQAKLPGTTGQLMNKYHRRFDYVLQNKTRFRGVYDSLYPDTVKMAALYVRAISKDDTFRTYFHALTAPLERPAAGTLRYTQQELMNVASKFFYCDRVKPDSTVDSHICVALNGVAEARWEKDYTLLEAFCFEAIFENMRMANGSRNPFVDNFVRYRKEGEQSALHNISQPLRYLADVRAYCFTKMEADSALRSTLLTYYAKTRSTLPFTIE